MSQDADRISTKMMPTNYCVPKLGKRFLNVNLGNLTNERTNISCQLLILLPKLPFMPILARGRQFNMVEPVTLVASLKSRVWNLEKAFGKIRGYNKHTGPQLWNL